MKFEELDNETIACVLSKYAAVTREITPPIITQKFKEIGIPESAHDKILEIIEEVSEKVEERKAESIGQFCREEISFYEFINNELLLSFDTSKEISERMMPILVQGVIDEEERELEGGGSYFDDDELIN